MSTPVPGCIIAGGLARRMGGGDKGDIRIGGRSMLAHIISRLEPQVSRLAINANGDPARFEDLGLPIIGDPVAGHPGPLAGLLAALEWADAPWVVTVPSDTPFLPDDLVIRFQQAAAGRQCVIAQSGGRPHPVCGLWSTALAPALRNSIDGGLRKAEQWTLQLDCGFAEWPVQPYDRFFNINTPEDIVEAERIFAAYRP